MSAAMAAVAQPLAAGAVDGALEVVAVLVGAVAAGAMAVQNLLHAVEGLAVDDGLVASLALDARAGHDPGVEVVSEYPVDHAAREHVSEFREYLRELLAEATGLLDAHDPADSDTWHALGRRLEFACEALASASYCLYEWPEPDDSRADLSPRGKGDRRTPNTTSKPEPSAHLARRHLCDAAEVQSRWPDLFAEYVAAGPQRGVRSGRS
jgi:hypothetical protein